MMSANAINPQEIFLLERYSSLKYLGELRDTWEAMLKHAEQCLDRFMRDLPSDYRSRPTWEQPDFVWGERVLPNFRDTYRLLCEGYIKLSHGDASGLRGCHGPTGDHRGMMDIWSGWLTREEANTHGELFHKAVRMASNIQPTEGGYWRPGALTTRFSERDRGPLDRPISWPIYRLVHNVQVQSGLPLQKSGIYVSDAPGACAQFLSAYYPAATKIMVVVGMEDVIDPITGEKEGEEPVYGRQPCTWTLVERVADTGGLTPTPSLLTKPRIRVEGGQPCPQAGFYFAPAQDNSRRHFSMGDVMPTVESPYGKTIWQWDERQG